MDRVDYVYSVVQVMEDDSSFVLGFYETKPEAERIVEAYETLTEADPTFLANTSFMWVQTTPNLSKPSNQTVEGVHD